MLSVSRKGFYVNIEPPWCHQTCVLHHLQNNLNISIKNKKFQTNFAVKICKYSMMWDIVKIVAWLFVFSYKNTKFFVILKIEFFCCLFNHRICFNTLTAINVFRFLTFFNFQVLFFFRHTFLLTKNVIPCDKDVNKNYLKHT